MTWTQEKNNCLVLPLHLDLNTYILRNHSNLNVPSVILNLCEDAKFPEACLAISLPILEQVIVGLIMWLTQLLVCVHLNTTQATVFLCLMTKHLGFPSAAGWPTMYLYWRQSASKYSIMVAAMSHLNYEGWLSHRLAMDRMQMAIKYYN